jgi:hypothetical protein
MQKAWLFMAQVWLRYKVAMAQVYWRVQVAVILPETKYTPAPKPGLLFVPVC